MHKEIEEHYYEETYYPGDYPYEENYIEGVDYPVGVDPVEFFETDNYDNYADDEHY